MGRQLPMRAWAGAWRRWPLAVALGAVLLASLLPAPLADAQRVSDVRGTRHNLSTSGPGSTHAAPSGGTSEVCVFCHTPHSATRQDEGGTPLRSPLWNRRVPAGTTYTPYTSSTLDAQSIADGFAATPGGSSKLCLSCHDGTLALGNVNVLNGQANATIPMTGTGPGGTMPPGQGATTGFTRFLGTDLRNDHPISVSYTTGLAQRDGELRVVDGQQRWPPGSTGSASVIGVRASGYKPLLPLEPTGAGSLGQLQCATCHDPHLRELDTTQGNPKFLRASRFQEVAPTAAPNLDGDILCLSCHDKNGGFGIWAQSAHARPDVAEETYRSTSAALREFPDGLPVWKAACLNCHDTHTAQGARRLTREGVDGAQIGGSPLAARQGGGPALENTCYQCHTSAARSALNSVVQVPDIESAFSLRIRMPITTVEQGAAEEPHDPSSSFSEPAIDCTTATNRCGADGIEPATKLAQRHAECTDCHNPHRVIRNRLFNANPGVPDAKGTHRNDPTSGYTVSNLASGVLRGAWGVEPVYGSASFHVDPGAFTVKRGDPGASVGTAASQSYVTREYQICLKCHSNHAYGNTAPLLGRPGGTSSGTNNLTRYTNQARELQPPAAHRGGGIGDVKNLGSNGGAGSNYNSGNHRSWHPVIESTGRDIARRGITAGKNPWVLPWSNSGSVGAQTMYCSDCHGSRATTPGSLAPDSGVAGPHGSQNDFLLKAPFNASDPSLCFKCHEREVYSPTGDSRKSGFWTGFCCRGGRGDGNDQLHWFHWNKILSSDPGRVLKCNWCHAAVPHGWKNKALLVNLNDVGEEAGLASGNREFRSSASAHAYNQEPYYLNAKVKIRTFATSGNWSDANCGSANSPTQFGTNTNSNQTGKDWMKDVCSNPP
jgi:predicted CXXCH cytochrome family protein